jgi:hypothetical protein
MPMLPKTPREKVILAALIGVAAFFGWIIYDAYLVDPPSVKRIKALTEPSNATPEQKRVLQKAYVLFEESDSILHEKYMELSALCDYDPSRCIESNAAIFNLRHDMRKLCQQRAKYCLDIEAIISKAQRLSPWVPLSDWD